MPRLMLLTCEPVLALVVESKMPVRTRQLILNLREW